MEIKQGITKKNTTGINRAAELAAKKGAGGDQRQRSAPHLGTVEKNNNNPPKKITYKMFKKKQLNLL